MMYCEHCNRLIETSTEKCPSCGNRSLRQPNAEDYCFLMEQEPMWGEMLADVLKQNGIAFVIQKELGGGLADRVGPILERYYLYVKFGQLDEARNLAAELFPAE